MACKSRSDLALATDTLSLAVFRIRSQLRKDGSVGAEARSHGGDSLGDAEFIYEPIPGCPSRGLRYSDTC